MTETKTNFLMIGPRIRLAALSLAFLTVTGLCGAQQNPPQLQISSPANGSVVNPGQTISVTVTSPANVAFSQVAVVGQGPLGFSDIANSVPATFSFAIPTDTSCGTYALTADGKSASGQYANMWNRQPF
jgi:hypothetical protein